MNDYQLVKKDETDHIQCDFVGQNYADKTLIGFKWMCNNIGFGEFWFEKLEDGTVKIDNEMMSKGFIKRMMCAWVDSCALSDDEDDAVNDTQGEENLGTFFRDHRIQTQMFSRMDEESRGEVVDNLIAELEKLR